MDPGAYVSFARDEWRQLRAATPLTLGEEDLAVLQGVNEAMSLAEVGDVYLPLSRLLNLRVTAQRHLRQVTDTFLGHDPRPVPFVVGIVGSVAVGKSTTARVLQALLQRWADHPRVDLVTTDGFLLPNATLEARGLMARKGFPESYDLRRLLDFLGALRRGVERVEAPVYSHLTYDVVPDERQVVCSPDVVILEGLNLLQPGEPGRRHVADELDFTIYVDAAEADVEEWYVERFRTFTATAFRDDQSFFRLYASLTPEQAESVARRIWREINLVNLHDNVLPTRERADLVLEKGRDHSVTRVHLRRR